MTLEPASGGSGGRRSRPVIIVSIVAASALCIGLFAFIQTPSPAGKFPSEFSESEKRQIISAAQSDGLRQTVNAIKRGQFHEAWRWVLNSRRQTVRSIGQQREGMIWVTFGVDDPKEPEGYFIWARYIMKKEKGRWMINGPSF